jgi:sporulation protein YlmC with PRC-barrel domain
MTRSEKRRNRKNIASVVAMAGILSLGTAPAWAQQSTQNKGQQSSPNKATQSKQGSPSRQQAKMADNLIAVNELQDQRVLDAQNREVGTITNVFIDTQSGKVERADIEFSTSLFGADHKYSVAWDKLKVREQGQDVVVTLDESIVKRVQQAGKSGRVAEGDGVYSQRQDGGILGIGDSGRDQQPISTSQLSAEQIRKVQQKLNQEGFHAGQVDGKWSSETQTAIRNFQNTKGIKATGQLDERTLDQLGLDADEFRQKKQSGSTSGSKPGNR